MWFIALDCDGTQRCCRTHQFEHCVALVRFASMDYLKLPKSMERSWLNTLSRARQKGSWADISKLPPLNTVRNVCIAALAFLVAFSGLVLVSKGDSPRHVPGQGTLQRPYAQCQQYRMRSWECAAPCTYAVYVLRCRTLKVVMAPRRPRSLATVLGDPV